jgi:hypothetical protein
MGYFLVYYFKDHDKDHNYNSDHGKVGENGLVDAGLHIVETQQTANPK